jgi:prepilin peptidase CpaA
VNLAATAPSWLLIVLGVLLFLGAAEDLWRYRISNFTVLGVLATTATALFFSGLHPVLWQNFAVFCLVLAVGTFLFSAGLFGGGDVKLLAAVGTWFSLGGALTMISAIFLAGGALALVALTFWRLRRRGRARPRDRAKNRLPYGIAIAVGAGFALFLTYETGARNRVLDFSPERIKGITGAVVHISGQ